MKRQIEELAVFGGSPVFAEKLHVGRPNIGDREKLMERFNDILDRRWLTNNGPYVQELERKLAEYLGVRHCIVMCNATVALEIAIRALDLKGEVIVPAFTFIATAHALQWEEITPVFCDIDPATHTIDPDAIKEKADGEHSYEIRQGEAPHHSGDRHKAPSVNQLRIEPCVRRLGEELCIT